MNVKNLNPSDATFWNLTAQEQSSCLSRLATEALKFWGVEDLDPVLIKYRENAVFSIRLSNDKPAVLRVHRQSYHSDKNLLAELEWTAMLANAGVVVPRPIPTTTGEMLIKLTSDELPGLWQIDVLSWLDGHQLGNVGEPLNLGADDLQSVFFALGKTMGELHNHSEAWPRQMQVSRHAWDEDGLVGDTPFWGKFWELDTLNQIQRELLLNARTAIEKDLIAYGKCSSNYGLIHADLVPENVFVSANGIQLIDFDDAGFGWHVFELVTALYWLAQEPQYAKIESSVIAGYQSVRSLTDDDLAMMPVFYAARSLTYVGWVHTRPSNETAIEMTGTMVDLAEQFCTQYLVNRCE